MFIRSTFIIPRPQGQQSEIFIKKTPLYLLNTFYTILIKFLTLHKLTKKLNYEDFKVFISFTAA